MWNFQEKQDTEGKKDLQEKQVQNMKMVIENEEENNTFRWSLYWFCNPAFISNTFHWGYLA